MGTLCPCSGPCRRVDAVGSSTMSTLYFVARQHSSFQLPSKVQGKRHAAGGNGGGKRALAMRDSSP